MIKWFAAIIGYSFLRFPGAILGFMIGGFIEFVSKNSVKIAPKNNQKIDRILD